MERERGERRIREGGEEGQGGEKGGRMGGTDGRRERGGKKEDMDLYIYHNYKRTILYHSAYIILYINYKYVGILRTSLD